MGRTTAPLRGLAVVADALAASGVATVFSLIGDANLFIVEQLHRRHSVRIVSAAHEAAAVAMADGWARVSRRVGIATVTHGPGLTNTVTALTEAVRHRTPLVLLAGDTARGDDTHSQYIDQAAVVRPTGARFVEPVGPETLHSTIRRSMDRARIERIPVVINLPVDILQAEAVDVGGTSAQIPAWEPTESTLQEAAELDAALGIVISANRPLILAGRGAVLSGARDAIAELAQAMDAPVATTLLAKDLFRDDPGNVGIFGTLSSDATATAIAETDCVLAFGASLNDWTTMRGSLLEAPRVVQVDTNHEAIHPAADVAIIGDARDTADSMRAQMDAAGLSRGNARRERMAREQRSLVDDYPWSSNSLDAPIELRPLMVDLELALPRDRAVVVDAGRFMRQPMRIVSVPDPTSFVFTCNFAAVGIGMAAAVGAGVARPDRPTVAFLGDGGFMLGGQGEFNAAVRHGVDLVAVVLNDGAYGAEYVQLEAAGLDPELSLFEWPDLAQVARALGGEGATVRTRRDVPAALAAIADRTGPLLVDVRLDPRTVPSEPR